MKAVHLEVDRGLLGEEFSQTRCNRQGMKTNVDGAARVAVTATPADVTCKDCRRLARLDLEPAR